GRHVYVNFTTQALRDLTIAPLRVVQVYVCTEILTAITIAHFDGTDALIARIRIDVVAEVDEHVIKNRLAGEVSAIDEDVVVAVDVVVKSGFNRPTEKVFPIRFLFGVIIFVDEVVNAFESLVRPGEGNKSGQRTVSVFHLSEQAYPVYETIVVVIDFISGSAPFIRHVFFQFVNIPGIKEGIEAEQVFDAPIMKSLVVSRVDSARQRDTVTRTMGEVGEDAVPVVLVHRRTQDHSIA